MQGSLYNKSKKQKQKSFFPDFSSADPVPDPETDPSTDTTGMFDKAIEHPKSMFILVSLLRL